jgi:hypothetical protein
MVNSKLMIPNTAMVIINVLTQKSVSCSHPSAYGHQLSEKPPLPDCNLSDPILQFFDPLMFTFQWIWAGRNAFFITLGQVVTLLIASQIYALNFGSSSSSFHFYLLLKHIYVFMY